MYRRNSLFPARGLKRDEYVAFRAVVKAGSQFTFPRKGIETSVTYLWG